MIGFSIGLHFLALDLPGVPKLLVGSRNLGFRKQALTRHIDRIDASHRRPLQEPRVVKVFRRGVMEFKQHRIESRAPHDLERIEPRHSHAYLQQGVAIALHLGLADAQDVLGDFEARQRYLVPRGQHPQHLEKAQRARMPVEFGIVMVDYQDPHQELTTGRPATCRRTSCAAPAYASRLKQASALRLPAWPILRARSGSATTAPTESAIARGSWSGTRNPVSRSTMISSGPPQRVATTGRLVAMASTTVRPNGS